MRLSDQDSAKDASRDSEKDASQGVILVSTKGPMEGASKVGVAEGSSKDVSQDFRIGRNARSKITTARAGHFKNFFMC